MTVPPLVLAALLSPPAPAAAPCLEEGARAGPWRVAFTGYGCVRPGEGGFSLDSRARSAPARPMAALLVGESREGPLVLRARVRTLARVGREPWKAGWIVWGYADRRRFYYFIPKENGWELGKRDPAYPGGQRFLATGRSPAVPLGEWADVEVRHDGDRLEVSLGGRRVVSLRDRERPYRSGRVALYVEGAAAEFEVEPAKPAPRRRPKGAVKPQAPFP